MEGEHLQTEKESEIRMMMMPQAKPARPTHSFNCPKCQTPLVVDVPFSQIFNAPDYSMLMALHHNDETQVTCPNCNAHYLPMLQPSSLVWSWIQVEKQEDSKLVIAPSGFVGPRPGHA